MNIQQIATRLMQDEVVAYPTEAVFGLGCNPLSESAVRKLLDLKQRPIEKGLILIAPNLHFFTAIYRFFPFIRRTTCALNRLNMNIRSPGWCRLRKRFHIS